MATSVGVLFVQGIGKQAPGATLSNMGDPLISWVRDWSRGHGVGDLTVLTKPEDPRAPRHVNAEWADDGNTCQLILAESWWAESFAPPSVKQVLIWAPVMTWRAIYRIGVFLAWPALAVLVVLFVFTIDDLVFFVWGALAGLLVLLLVLPLVLVTAFVILRILPGTKRMATSLGSMLTGHLGDAWVLRSSETRFAAMRARCLSDLTWLSERCERVVLVAHSQGSVVAAETLAAAAAPRCDVFVTVGSAIRLLRLPGHDPVARIREIRPAMRWLNVYSQLDPVSAGPIVTNSAYPVEIIAQNAGSALAAHVTYPTNKEGFQSVVLAAMRYAARLSGELHEQPGREASPFTSAQEREFQLALRLRESRSTVKSLLRFVTPLVVPGTALLLLSAGWHHFATSRVRSIEFLPDWIATLLLRELESERGSRVLVGVSALALAMAYQMVVVGSVHRWWDRRATAQLAAGKPSRRMALPLMFLVLTLLPLLATPFAGTILDGHHYWWAYSTAIGAIIVVFSTLTVCLEQYSELQFDEPSSQFLRQQMGPGFPAFAPRIFNIHGAYFEREKAQQDTVADRLAAHVVGELGATVRTLRAGERELRFPSDAVVVLMTATFAGNSEGEATFASNLPWRPEANAFLLIDFTVQQGGSDMAIETLNYYLVTEPKVGTSVSGWFPQMNVTRGDLASAGAGPLSLRELTGALAYVTRPV